MKRNLEICKAQNLEQAKCIIKMEQARSKSKGYSTEGYEICELLKEGEIDLKCGWYRREKLVKYPNGREICFCGSMYRKDK